MSMPNGLGESLDQFGRGAGPELNLEQFLSERSLFGQFQGEKGQTLRLTDFENLHDIGVLQRGDRLGFDLEPAHLATKGTDRAGTF